MMLGLIADSSEAGYYAASTRFTAFLNLIPTLQLTAALPQIARLVRDDDLKAANAVLRRLSSQAAMVCIPTALVMSLAPGWLLSLFGPSFDPAVNTLRILGPIQCLIIMLGPVSLVMTVVGLERRAARLLFATLALGTPLLAFSAMAFGSVGAALAAGTIQVTFALVGALTLRSRGLSPSILVPESSRGKHA